MLDSIHTVAPWDEAIDRLAQPPTKLILARPEAMQVSDPLYRPVFDIDDHGEFDRLLPGGAIKVDHPRT